MYSVFIRVLVFDYENNWLGVQNIISFISSIFLVHSKMLILIVICFGYKKD